MTINVLEKRTRSKRQVVEKSAKNGGRATIIEAKVESWVDPYNPDEAQDRDEQFLLESSSEDYALDDLN